MSDREESFSDINPFSLKSKNSSNVNKTIKAEERPKVKFNPNDLIYDLTGDKQMFIFNHYNFKATRFFKNKAPSRRNGTEQDVKALQKVFGEELGFNITVYNDLEYKDFWDTLVSISREDYKSVSCLSVVILTHGSTDGVLYAADRTYELKDVIGLFENHPTLVNKPKLFFIQACRGEGLDAGTVCYDGDIGECTYVTPSQADFLVMRSTVEDYRSYRDIRGSWLIQELCKMLLEHHKTLDILHIITRVHQKVAYNYITNTPSDTSTHDKKQIPETTFTLTKILKF